jgi:acetyl esterase/lipase
VQVLLLQAGDDEIVPDGQARMLEDSCTEKGLRVERQVISSALHQDVMMKAAGRRHIVQFVTSFVDL